MLADFDGAGAVEDVDRSLDTECSWEIREELGL